MKKASEYRKHAEECRGLAGQIAAPGQRAQMIEMANHWEQLARDRVELISKYPELAHVGEAEEERG